MVCWCHARHWLEIFILWQVSLKHLERLHILHKWHGFEMPPWRTMWFSTAGSMCWVDIWWYFFKWWMGVKDLFFYSFLLKRYMFHVLMSSQFTFLIRYFWEGLGVVGSKEGLVWTRWLFKLSILPYKLFILPKNGRCESLGLSSSLKFMPPTFCFLCIFRDPTGFCFPGGPGLKRPNTMQFWKVVAFYLTWKPCPMAIWRRSGRRVWIFQVTGTGGRVERWWSVGTPVLKRGRWWCHEFRVLKNQVLPSPEIWKWGLKPLF